MVKSDQEPTGVQVQGLPWEAAPGWLLKAARQANGGTVPRGFYIDPFFTGPGLRLVMGDTAHIIYVQSSES